MTTTDHPRVADYLDPGTPPPEFWVAGYPSPVGGADTELDNQITLWRRAGVEVHLCPCDDVPLDGRQPATVESVNRRGVHYHEFKWDIFTDKFVLAMCNDGLLKRLAKIYLGGAPRAVWWANCMTWPMDAEKECHELGLITYHAYQSQFQKTQLLNVLSPLRPVNVWDDYRPWFDADGWSGVVPPITDHIGFGRVSRDDGSKFTTDLWKMLGQIISPHHVKAFVLGFGDNALEKCGDPAGCPWLDYATYPAGTIPARELFDRIHVMVHMTGGSKENWPRVVMESWASGVVPIVDNEFGVAEMVTHGVDGFHAANGIEASWYASQLAHDDGMRVDMANAGLSHLRDAHTDPEPAVKSWASLWQDVCARDPVNIRI